MDWIEIIAAVLAAWNLIVFAVYGIDKGKAKRGARRISENTLLTLALIMGGFGAFLGMRAFCHKTKHTRFKIGVPLLLVLNIALTVLFIRSFDMGLQDDSAVYVKISSQEAKAMMDDASVVILDVRTEDEFMDGHIEGAVMIPDYELADRAETELPDKNAVILVYCRSGRRSELAAIALIGLGYKKVYDFGGILDWPYDMVTASGGK